MEPIRAIGYNLTNLINFNGRATRSQFWPYVVFVFVLYFAVTGAIMGQMQGPPTATVHQGGYSISIHGHHPELMPDFNRMMSLIIVGFVAIVFLLAASVVRRLHDRGKSGAWGLMPIPFIVFASVAMPTLFNQFGENTLDLGLFFALFINNLLYLASIIFLIVLLCGASTKGENRYGPERATEPS